ncbi:hypothetical protein PF011_g23629 [Phytophthora fragariae]|uniref:Uncharacterized protein n=1 Tax=Phytophthora fragariae TaxID=53985 RepID=A0A6A3ICA6_9STRA|nr:hypothetical protein PF011_g23629 [Phytophthora fragariae]
MINDYSYPRGASVNEFTNRDNFPSIAYNPPRDIARRIHSLRSAHPNEEVLLMLGDVSGAFRHVPVHEDDVHIAVVWASKRLSRHPTVQLYNRLLSLTEFEHQLAFTAEHIPGKLNTMADEEVRPPFDNLSSAWDRLCAVQPSQGLQQASIVLTGLNGATSPGSCAGHHA